MLTTLTRNRNLLARQALAERSGLPLPELLDRIGGIQAQYAPSMYFGLWSRSTGFERADLTGALERFEVVVGTLQRETIHLVSAADYWPTAIAVRDARRAWWLRAHGAGRDAMTIERALAPVIDRLGEGPATQRELEAIVPKPALAALHTFADVLRVPPSSTWEQRRANRYALATSVLGPEPVLSTADAQVHLVRRYLSAFGPALPADIAKWMGVPVTPVRTALARLDLRHHTDERGRSLVDLVDAELLHLGPPPVRLLPTWEATLLVHCRDAAVIAEDDRPRIFHTRNPQSTPTFTVGGCVAGTWQIVDDHVVIDEPWRTLEQAERAAVDAEADALSAWLAPPTPS